MLVPEVIGFRLTDALPEGVTATDLVLTVTQMLRAHGVVGKFVEFYGDGLSRLSLPDRATIANMSPEFGATCTFFPVDQETLKYLRGTGRDEELVELVEAYHREQGLWRTDETPEPRFTEVLELDLSTVEASLAGPRRPQDRVALDAMQPSCRPPRFAGVVGPALPTVEASLAGPRRPQDRVALDDMQPSFRQALADMVGTDHALVNGSTHGHGDDAYNHADEESFPASDTPNPDIHVSTGEDHTSDDTESMEASDTPAGATDGTNEGEADPTSGAESDADEPEAEPSGSVTATGGGGGGGPEDGA